MYCANTLSDTVAVFIQLPLEPAKHSEQGDGDGKERSDGATAELQSAPRGQADGGHCKSVPVHVQQACRL